jgi:hypothetical protein
LVDLVRFELTTSSMPFKVNQALTSKGQQKHKT